MIKDGVVSLWSKFISTLIRSGDVVTAPRNKGATTTRDYWKQSFIQFRLCYSCNLYIYITKSSGCVLIYREEDLISNWPGDAENCWPCRELWIDAREVSTTRTTVLFRCSYYPVEWKKITISYRRDALFRVSNQMKPDPDYVARQRQWKSDGNRTATGRQQLKPPRKHTKWLASSLYTFGIEIRLGRGALLLRHFTSGRRHLDTCQRSLFKIKTDFYSLSPLCLSLCERERKKIKLTADLLDAAAGGHSWAGESVVAAGTIQGKLPMPWQSFPNVVRVVVAKRRRSLVVGAYESVAIRRTLCIRNSDERKWSGRRQARRSRIDGRRPFDRRWLGTLLPLGRFRNRCWLDIFRRNIGHCSANRRDDQSSIINQSWSKGSKKTISVAIVTADRVASRHHLVQLSAGCSAASGSRVAGSSFRDLRANTLSSSEVSFAPAGWLLLDPGTAVTGSGDRFLDLNFTTSGGVSRAGVLSCSCWSWWWWWLRATLFWRSFSSLDGQGRAVTSLMAIDCGCDGGSVVSGDIPGAIRWIGVPTIKVLAGIEFLAAPGWAGGCCCWIAWFSPGVLTLLLNFTSPARQIVFRSSAV